MRFLLPILLAATASHAFVVQPGRLGHSTALRVSAEIDVPIILNGQNIDLTPALVDHVNKKIGAPLKKLASHGAVTECDVILSVNKNPKVRVFRFEPVEIGTLSSRRKN